MIRPPAPKKKKLQSLIMAFHDSCRLQTRADTLVEPTGLKVLAARSRRRMEPGGPIWKSGATGGCYRYGGFDETVFRANAARFVFRMLYGLHRIT